MDNLFYKSIIGYLMKVERDRLSYLENNLEMIRRFLTVQEVEDELERIFIKIQVLIEALGYLNPEFILSKTDILLYAPRVIASYLKEAYLFPQNPLVFIPNIKKAIICKREFEFFRPEMKYKSLRYFFNKDFTTEL